MYTWLEETFVTFGKIQAVGIKMFNIVPALLLIEHWSSQEHCFSCVQRMG